MGLLSALKLPRPKSWPTAPAANEPLSTGSTAPDADGEDDSPPPPKVRPSAPRADAPTARPAKDAAGAGAGAPVPSTGGADDDPNAEKEAAPGRAAEAGSDTPTGAEAEVDAEAADAVPEGGPVELQAETEAVGGKAAAAQKPTTNEEVGYGDFSLGLKESADGASLVVKYEHKQNVAAQNFKVWVIPCYVKADLKIGIEGEIVIKGKGDRQLNVKSGGALELGIGGTSEAVTAGPYGEVALSASTKVPTRLSEAREVAMNPFVVDIYGTGKVGIKFELKDSWTRNADCELANWHLFVVHVGAYQNGRFGPTRVEPGKDMQRLFAALQQAGPAIADAVEKYAPDKVKKAAEDGARWVAESDDAKKIADGTEVVLDKIKEKTGVDIGAGTESVVRDLVDPGGETSTEATKRVEAEMAALNASHEDFMKAVQALGLAPGGELQSQIQADADEYNAIVEVHHKEGQPGGTPAGAWKPMLVALAAKRRARKAALAAQQAEKKRREKAEGDAKAAADLARRVKESEAAMNAALTAANMVGNPLNNRTQGQPGSKARKYWETGMNKFWSPGSAARLKCASLQGEAKVAKAQEATALLVKARAVFQEGMRMIE